MTAPIDLRSDTVTNPSPGMRLSAYGPRRLRAVTHLDVSRADVERAARIILDTLR